MLEVVNYSHQELHLKFYSSASSVSDRDSLFSAEDNTFIKHRVKIAELSVTLTSTAFLWCSLSSPLFSYLSVSLKALKVYTLRGKCPNTDFCLVCILQYSDWIQENTDQKKLRIWTRFTHWNMSINFATIFKGVPSTNYISSNSYRLTFVHHLTFCHLRYVKKY